MSKLGIIRMSRLELQGALAGHKATVGLALSRLRIAQRLRAHGRGHDGADRLAAAGISITVLMAMLTRSGEGKGSVQFNSAIYLKPCVPSSSLSFADAPIHVERNCSQTAHTARRGAAVA